MRFAKPDVEAAASAGDFALEGATALLVAPEGRVLLQHRHDIPTIRYPDHWSTPGGVCEPGETPERTIRRELWEELGWEPGEIEPYGRILDSYRNLIHIFLASIDLRADELVLGEGRELRFFTSDALPEKTTPHAREVLAHYFSSCRME